MSSLVISSQIFSVTVGRKENAWQDFLTGVTMKRGYAAYIIKQLLSFLKR